ncbi:hypothetical protein [Sphingomonas lenta]|uniref:Uncharacterized protein n=1 Tax=Sphingomonas lenta TaxID=1141887 RepID=A0A2A2SBE6_9SPHN|nr:hypothetical protein [Sphingomonas lenta]PAX06577.1 hypothetical protein CKY28_15605 [Sphingomonas lenta]
MLATSFRNFSAVSRFAAALLAAAPLSAQTPAPTTPAASEIGTPPYADLADLVLASPVIADATIRSATRIKGAEAAGVAPGRQRHYVEADVAALVRAPGGLPQRVGYLLDVAVDARGRAPRLKKNRVLLFARPVAGAADQVQLVAPDAQLPWTPGTDAVVRRIAQEAGAGAPPAITGVGNAFHVPGALPGEGETQVFLQTADRRPVSLSVLRRPGEEKRWAVALSEIVDDAAGPPQRDTLLWYRLACGMPRALPPAATDQLSPEDAARAREDYQFVLQRLGPCVRQRTNS